MSIDTQRHKIRAIWDAQEVNSNQIDTVLLTQGKKQTQVKLSQSNSVLMGNNIKSFNSEWLPLQITRGTSKSQQSIVFVIEKTLPKEWIPYAKLNLAFRRVDGADIFGLSGIHNLIQICKISDIKTSTSLKKCIWTISFSQTSYNENNPWLDAEVKLFFTLINPHYITVS